MPASTTYVYMIWAQRSTNGRAKVRALPPPPPFSHLEFLNTKGWEEGGGGAYRTRGPVFEFPQKKERVAKQTRVSNFL